MIKLLIIEKQKLVTNVLQSFIQDDEAIKIVGCAQTGAEARKLCGALLPDVILIDMQQSSHEQTASVKWIKSEYSAIKILALTKLAEVDNVRECLGECVTGYIFKDMLLEELIQAGNDVYFGFRMMSARTYETFRKQIDGAAGKHCPERPVRHLKDKEQELIRHIAAGKSNRQIAESIYLSEGRVKNMITGLFKKLKVKNRYELVCYAYKNGIIG